MTQALEALQYPFMQQALWVALLLGLTCAMLSCFLVLKGWALMGDAISHAVLPGIVLAAATGMPLLVGALAAALVCALTTGWLETRSTLKSDTLLGIVFSGMFACGIIFFQKAQTDQHLSHILFGNLLGLLPQQRWQVLGICAIVLLAIALKWRDFMLFVFDSAHARLCGLRVPLLHIGLLVLLSLTAVAAMQAVGVVLVVAMLITPGMSAQLLVKRFHHMLLLAGVFSVITTCAGVFASMALDAATGACIVLSQAVGFALLLSLRFLLHLKNKQGV